MRNSKMAVSTAVLYVCNFTLRGSHRPSTARSTISPLSPSMPQVHGELESPCTACFALSAVKVRTVLAPQFCTSVRGIISRAWASALYGPWEAFCVSRWATAISIAPPPGTRRGNNIMLRATCRASWRLRSVSFKTSLLAPRNKTVHAWKQKTARVH